MKQKLLCTLCIGLFTASSFAVVELYEEPPVGDAYVDSVQTNTNFNTETLQIQGFGAETPPFGPDLVSIQQSYLKFDVSSLAGKTIQSAVFGVYLLNDSDYETPSLQLNYVGDDSWTETGITWANKPSSIEMIGTPELTDTIDRYYEWNVFDTWHGDENSDGFVTYMLNVNQQDVDNYAYFASRENTAYQPFLRIEYIPEPATMLLLGLGVSLVRKQRTARQ